MLLCGSVDAKKKRIYPAIIAKQDGALVECLAEYPDKVDAKTIKYKANKDSKTQKMKSDEIKAIRFFLENDNIIEMDRYPAISWKNTWKGKQKYSDPVWLNVLMRGSVTLYLNVIVTKSNAGTFTDYIER